MSRSKGAVVQTRAAVLTGYNCWDVATVRLAWVDASDPGDVGRDEL